MQMRYTGVVFTELLLCTQQDAQSRRGRYENTEGFEKAKGEMTMLPMMSLPERDHMPATS